MARRLHAVSDVIATAEVVEVLTARLPERVDSIVRLLLTSPRLPRLEQRARAHRLEAAQRAQRAVALQAQREAELAAEQAEAAQTLQDLAAIAALPEAERAQLERVACQHPLLRNRVDPPAVLLRAELLRAYRASRQQASA